MKCVKAKVVGPFKLHRNKGSDLLENPASSEKGIYLWTVKYRDGFLIDYIGETGETFYQRMKEHLIQILGGNYRICDPEKLLQGEEKILWNGLWRKGTKDKISVFIDNYESFAPIIKEYIQLHDIFFIPLNLKKRQRRLLEGNLAKIVWNQKPPVCNLLPNDIRYVYNKNEKDESFCAEFLSEHNICGLPKRIEI